jgi:hypothetical protein
MTLRHYVSYFGVYERWSLSMRLLEATLRFGYVTALRMHVRA